MAFPRCRPSCWLLAAALAADLTPPRTAAAQVRPVPFESLDLSLTLLADVGEGALRRHWSPGLAVAAGVALPFYLGTIESGLQYAHPEALRGDVPGFRSLMVYAGWSGMHHLGGGVHAGGGVRVGMMLLRFDGDTLPSFRRSESELGVAARGGLRWMHRGPWFAETAIAYQSVLTRPRIEQVFLSGGLGHRFVTPRWLRDFLD